MNSELNFLKSNSDNPSVGDELFYIPIGELFIVKVKVVEIYTQSNWDILSIWIDEPIGNGLYGWNEIYRTLAGAKSGLRSKKRHIQKPNSNLIDWRKAKIKFINGTWPKNSKRIKMKDYPKKEIWT